jgi:hypothetical protein
VRTGASLQDIHRVDEAEEFAGIVLHHWQNEEMAGRHALGNGAQRLVGICNHWSRFW